MINNIYYTKDDLITPSKATMSTTNPEVVKNIMKNVTDHVSLIQNIEKYNEDNKLPYNKRLQYSICAGNYYITVLKAYMIGTKYIGVIGWDQTGYVGFKYNENSNISSAMSSVSTHLISIDSINDVQLGSYDPDKLGDLFSFKTTDDISEKQLIKLISELFIKINSLISAGEYRNVIECFNYTVKKNNLNTYNYEHKTGAYNQYIKLFIKYVIVIKEIIMNYVDPGRLNKLEETDRIKNKFDFVEAIPEDIDELNRQRTFTHDEIEIFKQIIDWDNLKFDQNGNPFWN